MAYSRPGNYPEPPVFKTLADVQAWSKQLYAAMWDNDRQAEEFAYRTTDKDIKSLMFRPEWYGAKGDGITNDSAAIQAAINAANAAGGGVIRFGCKTYALASGLTMADNVELRGACPAIGYEFPTGKATVLKWTAATTNGIDFYNGGTYRWYCRLTDLVLNGNSVVTNVVNLSGVGNILDGVVAAYGTRGIYLVDLVNSCYIKHSTCVYNSGWGLCAPATGTLNTTYYVENCRFRRNGAEDGTGGGVYLGSGYQESFKNCVIESNLGQGMYITRPNGDAHNAASFENIWFESNNAGTTAPDVDYALVFDTLQVTPDPDEDCPSYFFFNNIYIFQTASTNKRHIHIIRANRVTFDGLILAGGQLANQVVIETAATGISFYRRVGAQGATALTAQGTNTYEEWFAYKQDVGTTAGPTFDHAHMKNLWLANTFGYGTATRDDLIINPTLSGGTNTNPTSYGGVLWNNGTDVGRIQLVADNPSASGRSQIEFWVYAHDSSFAKRAQIDGAGCFLLQTGAGATTSPADAFQVYSADITTGNAAPYFRTENGTILRPVPLNAVYPEDYGAKGDGATDDAAALQAAIDAAEAAKSVVILSSKTYLLKSGLTYNSNISIVGCGYSSILEVYSGGSAGFTVFTPAATVVSDVLFSNFTIDAGSNHYAATSNTPCFSVDKTSGVTLDRVRFINTDTMAVWCDSPTATPTSNLAIKNCRVETSLSGGFSLFGAVTDFSICDNYITGCGDDAIALQEGSVATIGQPSRGVIRGNRILNCVTRGGPSADASPNGILIYGGNNIVITGNEVSGVVACGIRVQYAPTYPSRYITVSGNTIENTGVPVGNMAGVPVHGIYILESNNVSVTGNSVYDCGGHGIYAQDAGLADPEDAVTGNIAVSGNTATLNHYVGIYFLDIKDSAITGNVCMDNGVTGTQYGILINGTDATHYCEDIIVGGNRCGDTKAYGSKTQTHGLAIVGASNRNIQIIGNNLEGNATASITNATASPNALFLNNVTSVRTAVKTQANATDVNIYIDSTSLMSVGDIFRVVLDDDSVHATTVAAILDTDLLTMADAIPASRHADVDAVVDVVGWKLYSPIHDTLVWDFDSSVNTTGAFKVDGTQVVSNRVVDARLADTPNSGDATTDGIIDALRDLVIAHGLASAT